ncbi:hypothetical protein [Xenorhabdus sp. PB62.4]|uniref:hypothetical protein n=1 Tax=Xenorhabdus sp. PB62.4 TaxID=1851573 RepID=UPI002102E024|nr:hypothetical protein [Xenorhabdus sp. PB62.4]
MAKGNKNAKPPEKPNDYDKMKMRVEGVKIREYNEDHGGGPIEPNGSWQFPGTGNTPKGLKNGLQNYKPIEWTL